MHNFPYVTLGNHIFIQKNFLITASQNSFKIEITEEEVWVYVFSHTHILVPAQTQTLFT